MAVFETVNLSGDDPVSHLSGNDLQMNTTQAHEKVNDEQSSFFNENNQQDVTHISMWPQPRQPLE